MSNNQWKLALAVGSCIAGAAALERTGVMDAKKLGVSPTVVTSLVGLAVFAMRSM